MKAILYVMCIIALLAVFSPISTLAAPLAADMISPKSDGGQCLTVNGADPTTAPGLVLDSCRGTPQQMWTHDSVSGKWQTGLYANSCQDDNSTHTGTAHKVRHCAESRELTLEPNPTLTDSWRIVSTTNVIDWGVYGVPAVASQNGWSYQLFSWLQPDVDVVNTQGCAIPYPLLVTDSAGYARELACDHIAKVQPPYYNANALRDPGVWPGTVASGA
ncbi:MAG: hypothetical protein HY870_02600, partial [Chloroflexi bacterium]|nr:hypothetical protein [Chloroflexota bacterium]